MFLLIFGGDFQVPYFFFLEGGVTYLDGIFQFFNRKYTSSWFICQPAMLVYRTGGSMSDFEQGIYDIYIYTL